MRPSFNFQWYYQFYAFECGLVEYCRYGIPQEILTSTYLFVAPYLYSAGRKKVDDYIGVINSHSILCMLHNIILWRNFGMLVYNNSFCI